MILYHVILYHIQYCILVYISYLCFFIFSIIIQKDLRKLDLHGQLGVKGFGQGLFLQKFTNFMILYYKVILSWKANLNMHNFQELHEHCHKWSTLKLNYYKQINLFRLCPNFCVCITLKHTPALCHPLLFTLWLHQASWNARCRVPFTTWLHSQSLMHLGSGVKWLTGIKPSRLPDLKEQVPAGYSLGLRWLSADQACAFIFLWLVCPSLSHIFTIFYRRFTPTFVIRNVKRNFMARLKNGIS